MFNISAIVGGDHSGAAHQEIGAGLGRFRPLTFCHSVEFGQDWAPRAARVADPLHLARLCRLHLARADRAALDDAAAAAPAEPRLQ